MTVADYVTLIAGLGIGGLGLLFLLSGVQFYFRGRQIMGEELTAIENLEPGPASVSGTARPASDGVLSSPFTERDCVAFEYEVRESTGGSSKTPDTIAEGRQCVSFYVDDGTGEILVRPDTADFELEKEERIEVAREEQPPEPIERFLSSTADIGDPKEPMVEAFGPGVGTRFFREQLIEPGEDVFVFGRVTEGRSEGFGETYLEIQEGVTSGLLGPPSRFIVADQPKDQIAGSNKWGGLLYIVIGIGLLYGARAAILATPLV